MKTDERVPIAIHEFAPDLLVVPESSRSPKISSGGSSSVRHLWVGDPKTPHHGLGVYAPTAKSLAQISEPSGTHRHSLAGRALWDDQQLDVLAIWTLPCRGEFRSRYLNSFDGILRHHDHLLEAGNTIVAGDLNTSGSLDPDELPVIIDRIRDRYGLVSCYHQQTGEELGAESAWTHWHQGKVGSGFHIDFVFVPDRWTVNRVDIGGFDAWGSPDGLAQSDHAPVVVDFLTS